MKEAAVVDLVVLVPLVGLVIHIYQRRDEPGGWTFRRVVDSTRWPWWLPAAFALSTGVTALDEVTWRKALAVLPVLAMMAISLRQWRRRLDASFDVDMTEPPAMPDWMRAVRDKALHRVECLGCGESLRGKAFSQKGGIVACRDCADRLHQVAEAVHPEADV